MESVLFDENYITSDGKRFLKKSDADESMLNLEFELKFKHLLYKGKQTLSNAEKRGYLRYAERQFVLLLFFRIIYSRNTGYNKLINRYLKLNKFK